MTRRDTLQTVHEPFGDAFYFGPERLHDRYENDPEERKNSGFGDSTYRNIFDNIARDGSEVRFSPPTQFFFLFHVLILSCVAITLRSTIHRAFVQHGSAIRRLPVPHALLAHLPTSWRTLWLFNVRYRQSDLQEKRDFEISTPSGAAHNLLLPVIICHATTFFIQPPLLFTVSLQRYCLGCTP